MIIAENIVKVPCNKYTLKVQCTKTIRLATMDWILLTCIHRFEEDHEMRELPLKYTFEKVFNMVSSEFLIKPCVNNLKKLKVITMKETSEFEYSKVKFKELQMTERGIEMLNNGLLPCESQEIGINIFYNPLTGKMYTFQPRTEVINDAVVLGNRDDYDNAFPEEILTKALQNGKVADQRLIASKYKIDKIDLLSTEYWDNQFVLSIGVDNENGEIYTVPELTTEAYHQCIKSILTVKGLNEKNIIKYSDTKESNIRNIIGSGNRIKRAILNVCKNGEIIVMDANVYKIVSANASAFRDKIVIFYNAESFRIERDEFLKIQLPVSFSEKDCVVINEKKEHVFLACGNYKYNEITMKVPVSYENEILNENILETWIYNIVKDNVKNNIGYLILMSLPVFSEKNKIALSILQNEWSNKDYIYIYNNLVLISSFITTIGKNTFNICEFKDIILSKIEFANTDIALEQIRKLMDLSIICENIDNKVYYAKNILKNFKKPETYVDMIHLYQAVGINSHDIALRFDNDTISIYNERIIKELIGAIMNHKFQKLPEFFAYDSFFNEYNNYLERFCFLLNKYDIFDDEDENRLKQAIENCPDISSLKSYMEQIRSKELYLSTQNINLFTMMQENNSILASRYYDNIKIIENVINGKYKKVKLKATQDKIKKDVFIIDTCALINAPDLIDYFSDDEYISIPTKVIDEIGKIKDGRSGKYDFATSNTARELSRKIESYLKTLNTKIPFRFIIENADVSLLPLDLDANVPDNQILSVALKYLEDNPVIISDDGVFRLTSISQNITTVSGAEFIASRSSQKIEINSHNLKTIKEEVYAPKTKDVWKKFPISKLTKYESLIDNNIVTYLSKNRIRNIEEFFELTEERVMAFLGGAKQQIYKNSICNVLRKKDKLIEKLDADNL